MKLTKNDMARVIVQALYNLPELPGVDHHKVVRIARRKKEHLEDLYYDARKVQESRVRRQTAKLHEKVAAEAREEKQRVDKNLALGYLMESLNLHKEMVAVLDHLIADLSETGAHQRTVLELYRRKQEIESLTKRIKGAYTPPAWKASEEKEDPKEVSSEQVRCPACNCTEYVGVPGNVKESGTFGRGAKICDSCRGIFDGKLYESEYPKNLQTWCNCHLQNVSSYQRYFDIWVVDKKGEKVGRHHGWFCTNCGKLRQTG